jgi:hypothetical protein
MDGADAVIGFKDLDIVAELCDNISFDATHGARIIDNQDNDGHQVLSPYPPFLPGGASEM